jgi:hypothetical protein
MLARAGRTRRAARAVSREEDGGAPTHSLALEIVAEQATASFIVETVLADSSASHKGVLASLDRRRR